MNNRRWGRRVTYRPSKVSGAFGLIFGCVFVLIGIFVVIPSAGAFGILWTLLAVCITGYNAYVAFGKKYIGPEVHIEDETPPSEDPEERLRKLRELYDQRLITEEEYEAKRRDILSDLEGGEQNGFFNNDRCRCHRLWQARCKK